MLDRVFQYIRRHRMLRAGDRVAVAVSGGADSVALLGLLLGLRDRLGITLAVAHFNHGLRGQESEEDERFVRELAAGKSLECFVERGASLASANVEEAARAERYAFFRRLVESRGAAKVATAHTADDQAETVLGRLLRGSGTRGLAGIFPVWEGFLIRPLLGERRAQVRAWAAEQGFQWREDTSNLDPRFLRNRLRQELIPLLEKDYNPGLVPVLSETAELARAEEQFWQARLEELASRFLSATSGGWKLALSGFVQLSEAEQRRLLRETLRKLRGHLRQIEFSHVEQVRHLALDSESGREARLPGCRIQRVFDTLIFERTSQGRRDSSAGYRYTVKIPGVCTIPETGTRLCFKLVDPAGSGAGYDKEEGRGGFAALDSIQNPVTVRSWRPGDVFQTSGGKKKLKALFAERRIPREQRLLWPVVTSREELIWARGFPVAEAFRWRPSAAGGAGILIVEEDMADAASHSAAH